MLVLLQIIIYDSRYIFLFSESVVSLLRKPFLTIFKTKWDQWKGYPLSSNWKMLSVFQNKCIGIPLWKFGKSITYALLARKYDIDTIYTNHMFHAIFDLGWNWNMFLLKMSVEILIPPWYLILPPFLTIRVWTDKKIQDSMNHDIDPKFHCSYRAFIQYSWEGFQTRQDAVMRWNLWNVDHHKVQHRCCISH